MGQSFIEDLLANISNEKALADGLDKLIEANKSAYQQAIDNLRNQQMAVEIAENSVELGTESRLDLLLRQIS